MSSITTTSSAALTSSASAWSRATGRGRFAIVGLGTVLAAVLANVLVYYIGGAVVAYDARFLPLTNASGAIVFTLPPAIGAVLLYAVLPRFTRRPARVFAIIAVVVLIVSIIPDLTYIPTVPGATAGQTTILVLMHGVAASVIVGMLTALARPRTR